MATNETVNKVCKPPMIGQLRRVTLQLTIQDNCGIELVYEKHTLNINDKKIINLTSAYPQVFGGTFQV